MKTEQCCNCMKWDQDGWLYTDGEYEVTTDKGFCKVTGEVTLADGSCTKCSPIMSDLNNDEQKVTPKEMDVIRSMVS